MTKILYVDCTRGLASDMLVASLADSFKDKDRILRELQDNIKNNMTLTLDPAKSYEREGLLFSAKDNAYDCHNNCGQNSCGQGDENRHGYHVHGTLADVYEFIDNTAFSDEVKNSAKGVYELIAEAEAEVHGGSADTVHFHEVGQKRAIACIVCACELIEASSAEKIVLSPINTGYGKVVCAHGEVDVPAPATKILLRGIPSFYESGLSGELCTPTGVALAKYFASDFVADKDRFEALALSDPCGIGLGSRDIGRANGVRVFAAEDFTV